MRRFLIAAVLVIAAGPVAADNTPMEQCAVQWRDMTAAGKTVGVDYRAYAAGCLKANRQVMPSAPSPGKSKPAKVPATGKRPNRMSVCAAQWRQMKAQNTTNGLTYRQFSSQCLRSR